MVNQELGKDNLGEIEKDEKIDIASDKITDNHILAKNPLEKENLNKENQKRLLEKTPYNQTNKQDLLVEHWAKILKSVKDQGPRISALVQMADPLFIGDDIIKVKIAAESQKELYKKYESLILFELRNAFNNKKILFEFDIDEQVVESNRPLSLAEQQKILLDENSAIETLKKTFDLDIKKSR